jgi:hypothetical protein
MKKIYNEDAAITAASSLIDGANAATSGIAPELLGLTALKYLTHQAFKYTDGLIDSKNSDKVINKKGLSDIRIPEKDLKNKKDLGKKFSYFSNSITTNPETYFKYIILEYMLIKLGYIEKEKISADDAVLDYFDYDNNKMFDLHKDLSTNNLNILIKKESSNDPNYPKTKIISSKYNNDKISKILLFVKNNKNVFNNAIESVFVFGKNIQYKEVFTSEITKLYDKIPLSSSVF